MSRFERRGRPSNDWRPNSRRYPAAARVPTGEQVGQLGGEQLGAVTAEHRILLLLDGAAAERNNIGLALLARSAELEQVETFQRAHVEAIGGQQLSHKDALKRLAYMNEEEGLRVFAQALTTNFASEFTLEEYNLLTNSRDGSVWIGTSGGLSRFTPHPQPASMKIVIQPGMAWASQ